MQTKYFRINKKEYCHFTNDYIFVTNRKEVDRIPPEHELGEGWGIVSILNYLVFIFLLIYLAISMSYYGVNFLKHTLNYGALFLLFFSLIRVKNGFQSSTTPTIRRKNVKSVYLKTPTFSYPRLVIYFEGPEGKVLRKTIPVLFKQEALPLLQEIGLIAV